MNSTPAIECEWCQLNTQLNHLYTNSIECTTASCSLHALATRTHKNKRPMIRRFVSWKNSIFDGIVAICWPIEVVFLCAFRLYRCFADLRIRCFSTEWSIFGRIESRVKLGVQQIFQFAICDDLYLCLTISRFCDMWLI